jgi:hypothetical protein
MSITEAFPEAVLLIPKGHDASLGYARGVVASIKGSPYFNPPPPELATLEADADAYDVANAAAHNGGRLERAERKAARKKVVKDLRHLRDRVQGVAEAQGMPADAATVITSAGMRVKKVTKYNKPPVSVRDGAVSGSVVLDALRVAKIAMYYWQLSENQQEWHDIPETMKAKLVVTGLTPGKVYYFRFRAMTRKGPVDFSQVVSRMVR